MVAMASRRTFMALSQAGCIEKFVDALVWGAQTLGVNGGGFAVASFLICCLVSTATGTSLGTMILCAPLLFPAGGVKQLLQPPDGLEPATTERADPGAV